MPSTTANIMDLLTDYEHIVKQNENISMLYIGYQLVLMIGTVLGPGTIFLMLVGAFVSAFGLDQWSSFYWNAAPILIFVIVCATCSSNTQLFFAGLISAIYGLVMMAVFVGVLLNISQDGFLAPSSLFFFAVGSEFIIAALIHPKEFDCLKYGVIYYVTVPSMYMLLVIYSVFNMNNISWGTRDVTIEAEDEEKEKEDEEDEEENDKKEDSKEKKTLNFLGADAGDNVGGLEFSLSNLFKCMFCTYKNDTVSKENEQLKQIQEAILQLNKKLENIENENYPELSEPRRTIINEPRKTVTTYIQGAKAVQINEDPNKGDNTSLPSDEISGPTWYYCKDLIKGQVDFLDKKELNFWNDFIKDYLKPKADNKKKVALDLKELRDKMVFIFFMLNSLFVLVVFLLTLKKNILHVDWPIDPKVNFTYVPDSNEILMYREYLQLEPIGFVFLIFFALLMIAQFFGMMVHRFATFSQVMANTKIDINLCGTKVENMSRDELNSKNVLQIVKELQSLKGLNNEDEDQEDEPVQTRQTVPNLMQGAPRPSVAPIFDHHRAFQARITEQFGPGMYFLYKI